MKTAVFYEHILEGAKQSGKSVAELMEKCASWNIRGIEIGDALLRENKEEIKELLEKNHMQVSCSNAFYDFGHITRMQRREKNRSTSQKSSVYPRY